MFDRLASLEDEFVSLEASLSDPEIGNDHDALRTVSKRYKELGPVVDCIRRRQLLAADAATARELLAAAEGTDRELWREELASTSARLAEVEEELRMLMLPVDSNEGKAVIVEVRGAEGGEEANLFARDLYEMYRAYAAAKGWAVDVLSSDPSDLGGINQITMLINGDTAWGRMKFEGGTHRVQRVPVTESQGRIHTSSATVLILAEAEEVEVDIDDRDLEIDVYRSSGPGGQGVNTTDSAVRITHRPTGVVVAMQDERSQLQNRARAMIVLRARLLKLAQEEQEAAMSVERRSQVGSGGRGEKIRTYNFKENRVTDHRIPFTTYRLQEVLAGDLDIVVDALAADERARQLAGDG